MYQPTKNNSTNKIIEDNAKLQDIDLISKEQKLRVLTFLNNISASYMSEIAWETHLTDYELKQILQVLDRDKMIENINVSSYDSRLIMRVQDQAMIGQSGLASFSRKRWFAITNYGKDFLQLNTMW